MTRLTGDSGWSTSAGAPELVRLGALLPAAVSAPEDLVPTNASSQPGSVRAPGSRSAAHVRSDGPLVVAPMGCPLLWLPSLKICAVGDPDLILAPHGMPHRAREHATFLTSR